MSSNAPDAAAARSYEQRDGFVLLELCEWFASIQRGQLERRDRHYIFAGDLERLPGCGDHAHFWSGAQDLRHELGGRLEQVLAVVEHEKELALPEMSQQNLHRLRCGLVSEIKSSEHGTGHQGRVRDLAKLDQPGSIREAPCKVGAYPNGEPRFAHAAWANQAHHACGRELLSGLPKLAAATDKCRCLRRQVARRVSRPGHPGYDWSCRRTRRQGHYASNQQS